ncbi:type 2 isopentenyl-diphosphate Delta-isomerase [Halobacillus ihumii]|uniref:type 2 isopentenyl-diphosphate Delta-isomerase n=1 Tax=Halobacillus ihumii TaxID=2686092 RepID=UPI0013D629E8|nr:type 2 isopentenyl-diphosphate Delta-isomerase [Halobacillus ihumii]
MSRSQRKLDHIRHALSHKRDAYNHFDDIELIHQSLTDLHWEHLDLSTKVGELNLSSPLFINAMTGGGGKKTIEINQSLARVSAQTGIGMAVGSQMAAIKDKIERPSFEIVRKENPNGVILANVGSEASVEQALDAVDMIKADALQIHVNTLQELIMPEGDRDFTKRSINIEKIVRSLQIPVIIKEVGYGMSKETVEHLSSLGVTYIDVGGRGGTNFSRVENMRREKPLSSFENWGIPTPISLIEATSTSKDLHILASGGIRNGLDGAKALVLGANAFGMAGSLLRTLIEQGEQAVVSDIRFITRELKMAMMLLGASEISSLRGKPHVTTGKAKDWLEQRSPKLKG